jgi:hypothetical protein
MNAYKALKIFRAPKHQIEQLAALLDCKPKFSFYPDGSTGRLEIDVEEKSNDCETFERFCKEHKIWFSSFRRRVYSTDEIEDAEFFHLADTPIESDTTGTKLTDAYVCPKCGVGLRQTGPLVVKLGRSTKRKMFCISLRHSNDWVITTDVSEIFEGFSGFRFGAVRHPENSQKPLNYLRQIIIESYLPRMASSTNFTEYDPPMTNKCACNRAGWNLRDEVIYERDALKEAKDFNLTVERWYGGGIAGLNWPIVSKRVRQVLLTYKILHPGCFDPVHIIPKAPGYQYKFDLPLDARH